MNADALKLAFVGDVCLNFFRRAPIGFGDFTGWPALQQQIGAQDFLIGNLECCLVDERCSEDARRQSMAVPAGAAMFLQAIGFTDLCLANNHSLDCGPEVIPVTRACLAAQGMRGFGSGANLDEAEQAVLVERRGRTVALLGACDRREEYATPYRGGIAPLEKDRLRRRVRAAAKRADLVVVSLHADLEFSPVPAAWRRRLSHALIDAGANLVVQHHPHVLQGIEAYRGGLIAYSLGNFIFRLHGNRYQERHAAAFDGMVLTVDADFAHARPALTWRSVPFRIGTDNLPHALDGAAHADALRNITALSALTCATRGHRRAWFQRCRTEARARLLGLYYAGHHGHWWRAARTAARMPGCREDRRWLLGLLSLGRL